MPLDADPVSPLSELSPAPDDDDEARDDIQGGADPDAADEGEGEDEDEGDEEGDEGVPSLKEHLVIMNIQRQVDEVGHGSGDVLEEGR